PENMGRRAGFHWDKREQAYRTDAGGRTRYFRGVAREDRAGIAAAFAAHLAALDAEATPPDPTVDDLCLAFLRAARGVRERTLRPHRGRLLKWCEGPPDGAGPILGAQRAAAVQARDLRAALRDWQRAGLSDQYRAGICRSVKAAWAWAAGEEGGRL